MNLQDLDRLKKDLSELVDRPSDPKVRYVVLSFKVPSLDNWYGSTDVDHVQDIKYTECLFFFRELALTLQPSHLPLSATHLLPPGRKLYIVLF